MRRTWVVRSRPPGTSLPLVTTPRRGSLWNRAAVRLGLVHSDDGFPRTGDSRRSSRYQRGIAGPSARLDEDIDELRARIAALESRLGD